MEREYNHRAVLNALPAQTRKELCAQSDGPGLLRLGLHLGAIATLGVAVWQSSWGWPALMVIQGVLWVFLFTTLHEVTHETAFRTTWINRATAWLTGAAVVLSPSQFRYFHLAHHRFTHDPVRDPELAGGKPETPWQYALYLSGLPDWRWRLTTLVSNALHGNQDAFVPDRAKPRIRREALLLIALYTVIAITAWQAALWAWLLPMLLGAPFLRAYLLAEHHLCPHVADMLSNTRTTFTNRAIRWLAWNMPYHAEHHAYPAVPFHRLPDLHRIMAPHLRETSPGYSQFNARVAKQLVSN
ncbi:MAG: fatty acid desaturase [Pseudomonadota bacterium]